MGFDSYIESLEERIEELERKMEKLLKEKEEQETTLVEPKELITYQIKIDRSTVDIRTKSFQYEETTVKCRHCDGKYVYTLLDEDDYDNLICPYCNEDEPCALQYERIDTVVDEIKNNMKIYLKVNYFIKYTPRPDISDDIYVTQGIYEFKDTTQEVITFCDDLRFIQVTGKIEELEALGTTAIEVDVLEDFNGIYRIKLPADPIAHDRIVYVNEDLMMSKNEVIY